LLGTYTDLLPTIHIRRPNLISSKSKHNVEEEIQECTGNLFGLDNGNEHVGEGTSHQTSQSNLDQCPCWPHRTPRLLDLHVPRQPLHLGAAAARAIIDQVPALLVDVGLHVFAAGHFARCRDMLFDNRWRDFGFMWAFCVFNVAAAAGLYWLMRVTPAIIEKHIHILQKRITISRAAEAAAARAIIDPLGSCGRFVSSTLRLRRGCIG
jgi:hypothetical protein